MSDEMKVEAAEPKNCPLSLESVSPQLRKYLEPTTKQTMRLMAAKTMIPAPPGEQIKALFILTYDQDEQVRSAAMETSGTLPEEILGPALKSDLPPDVLDFVGRRVLNQSRYMEMILLNSRTPDITFEFAARTVEAPLLGIIAENQIRLLRHEGIIRSIHENPNASGALISRVVDFAVRSGINLEDLPTFKEARKRILGIEDAPPPPPPEETAEGLLTAYSDELAVDREEELDSKKKDTELVEEKRLSLSQIIMQMSVSEKVKLASRGNKEARTLLLREANKLVQMAVVMSPKITDGEIIGLTTSKTIPEEILRVILQNREWMKHYQIKLNLANNPRTPLTTSIRLLPALQMKDLRALARSRDVPTTLTAQAKVLLSKRSK